MPQPASTEYAPFHQPYINQATSYLSAVEALQESETVVKSFLENLPEDKTLYAYAPGKWTIKEVVQHLVDMERIFSYRALCIARGEMAGLPGFDEKEYAAASGANYRRWDHLLEERVCLRKSIIQLFRSFNQQQLERLGTANGKTVSTNALGFIIAGHSLHHLQVLKERYLQTEPK
jgi:hypothetical protein